MRVVRLPRLGCLSESWLAMVGASNFLTLVSVLMEYAATL